VDSPEKHSQEWAEWVPGFLKLLDKIEKDSGTRIPLTWCCGAYHRKDYLDAGTILVAKEYPDIWKRIKDRGDEIGLSIYAGDRNRYVSTELGDTQFIWYTQEFQHLFLQQDIGRLVDQGFDPPKTYSSSGYIWRAGWAPVFIKAGIETDLSIVSLPPKYLAWGDFFNEIYRADITPYTLLQHLPGSYPFRPYRTAADSLSAPGTSELVELPVSGYIGNDFGAEWNDFDNSPPFDLTVAAAELKPVNWIAKRYYAFEKDFGRPFPGLYERWRMRNEAGVDIWPTFFQPGELHPVTMKRIEKFIRTVLEWDDVAFETVHAAVTSWKAFAQKKKKQVAVGL
jgi:peptidoglycan/xylan/chitin deacetylase (PgdA/CDA1 family)